MNILCICKMNQARSVFSASIVKKFMPDSNVSSAGVDAIPGSPTLKIVLETGLKWGLPIENTLSKSIGQVDFRGIDRVLVAEKEMKSVLGFTEILVDSYESYCLNPVLIPNDPAGLAPEDSIIELAKVFAATYRFIRKLKSLSNTGVRLIIPRNESDITSAIEFACSESLRINSILIDGDLRNSYRSDFKKIGWQWNKLSPGDEFDLTPRCVFYIEPQNLIPEFEIVSGQYFDILGKVSLNREILIVSPPIFAYTRKLPDAILLSAIADEITLIHYE